MLLLLVFYGSVGISQQLFLERVTPAYVARVRSRGRAGLCDHPAPRLRRLRRRLLLHQTLLTRRLLPSRHARSRGWRWRQGHGRARGRRQRSCGCGQGARGDGGWLWRATKTSGPTRLRTKVSTMIILNTVVRILALRLLLRLAFDCFTRSSLSLLDCGALYHAVRWATMRRPRTVRISLLTNHATVGYNDHTGAWSGPAR